MCLFITILWNRQGQLQHSCTVLTVMYSWRSEANGLSHHSFLSSCLYLADLEGFYRAGELGQHEERPSHWWAVVLEPCPKALYSPDSWCYQETLSMRARNPGFNDGPAGERSLGKSEGQEEKDGGRDRKHQTKENQCGLVVSQAWGWLH